MDQPAVRIETDLLGPMELPAEALHGIHTARSLAIFRLAGRPAPAAMIEAYGRVKRACAVTNRALGVWRDDPAKADAIDRACREMSAGELNAHVGVDLLQGGAGTSLNMNVNEVLANRALAILGAPPGAYERVSPLEDINLHQSTNDTYPTALKLAAITRLRHLEAQVVGLQEAFQAKEQAFAHVVKVGRTQLQDAVLTTLGREMGAYAEAFARDRWRIYKCEERLRVVNLGGTAIGSGIAAPREFIFRAVDALREETGIGFARAENLIESTQNADVYVEVSGILKAHATSLHKAASDLRLLASGPDAGLGEIRLPALLPGSSIMPGKVNPVVPEAVSQAAMLYMGYDATLGFACASGVLELNPFLPLVAGCLLEGIDVLARACETFRRECVEGITADEARCRLHVDGSIAAVTALLPHLGYKGAEAIWRESRASGRGIRAVAVEDGHLSAQAFDELTGPEAVTRLGSPPRSRRPE